MRKKLAVTLVKKMKTTKTWLNSWRIGTTIGKITMCARLC
jgi:hypothetical protein